MEAIAMSVDDIKSEILKRREQCPDGEYSIELEFFAMRLIAKWHPENLELIEWFGEVSKLSSGKIEELIDLHLEDMKEAAKRDIFIAICRNYDSDESEVTVEIVGVYEASENAIASLIDYEAYQYGNRLTRNDFEDHIDDGVVCKWQYQSPEYSAYRLIVVKQKLNPQSWMHGEAKI